VSVVPVTFGQHYVVSAGHELAALAAFEVLEGGGNAIDAGAAAILTLGVVYSDQVSVAGVAPMMIRLAKTGEIVTIAGVGGWPRSLDVEDYITRHGGEVPLGVHRTVVPATPDAVIQALERFGTCTFRDVAKRAIDCANNGFPRHQVMLDYITQYESDYRQWPENTDIWLPDGKIPTLGEPFMQPDLARTLTFLCDEEQAAGDDRSAGLAAVRRAFYQGDIAQQILSHHRNHDGLLLAEDLSNFRCQVLPSLSRKVLFGKSEVEVHTCGAWCQGPTLLQAMAILETVDLEQLGYGSDAYYHVMTEAIKLALADREGYLGDPDYVDVPLDTLISSNYGAQRARMIDPHSAAPGMPLPGTIPGHKAYQSPAIRTSSPDRLDPDTSIVCVIDAEGNAICATPSDTSWDTPVVPGTGLAISSRGDQSWAVHGHPSVLAPGKRPRLTPNPCFLQAPGQWIMPFGTPGGDAQVQANLQVLYSHLYFGMPLQDAIEAPRLITHSQPNSFAPHHAQPGHVTIEGRVSESVTRALNDRGHKVERLADWTHAVAGVCAVRKDLYSGHIEGGADPRRSSRAMGW
jgi:gamma-glutamyltranspeptidase/glutathione hydrolase